MDELSDRAEFLRLLGDPTRLRLLRALRIGELTVAEITRVTGLSQPRVSRHLKLLSDAGLLARTPDQNEVYYRLAGLSAGTALVDLALDGLRDSAILRQDTRRLQAILDGRRESARLVLAQLGISPLSAETRDAVDAAVAAVLARHLPAPGLGRVLDLGTGTGRMLRLLGPRADSAVGVDRSRDMRIVARASVLSDGLANCSVQAGDMHALGFEAASFDLVSIDRALRAVPEPDLAVREAARVLRPGGHLLVVEADDSPAFEAALLEWLQAADLTPLESRHAAAQPALVALSSRSAATPRNIAHAT
jgi:ubiquinone/menaquinone biosynthesis C-methylase UbiE/DNA-binding transcriptional ArsR family regulator